MVRFRHGTVDTAVVESIDIEELYRGIEDDSSKLRNIENEEGEEYTLAEVALEPQLVRDQEGNPESLYFQYRIRDRQEYESMGDSGRDETRKFEPREVTEFLITASGDIAYEAGGSPRGPLGFLLEEDDPGPLYTAGMSLPQPVLTEHYRGADRVTSIQIAVPDLEPEDQPARIDSVAEVALQVAAFTETNRFSVEHYHRTRDLKEVELINELVERGTIDTVSAVHGDSNSMKLSDAGWADFYIPEEIGVQERASRIRDRVAILF